MLCFHYSVQSIALLDLGSCVVGHCLPCAWFVTLPFFESLKICDHSV